jgi:hypothetical protein
MIRLLSALLAGSLFLASTDVLAGSISFQLSLTGSKLTLTEQGDSSAFYPSALRLLPNGRWEPLAPAMGSPPAELAPGEHLDFLYPELSQPKTPLTRLEPTMVRFYDSAGVSFGQISFFHQPPPSSEALQAIYSGGQLIISPPQNTSESIRASWLLWPQEDGISQIRGPQKFEVRQPAEALRFDWHPGMSNLKIDTGAGQPAAILLHETASGYLLQKIPIGLQVSTQRSAWLNASRHFYGLALCFLLAALLAALLFIVARKNKMPKEIKIAKKI